MRNSSESPRGGFTLVELLVVIAIIGLIMSLILVAASDGVRRAEERATQALITKIDTALNDRIDALLNTQPVINQTHRYLAAINYSQDGRTYLPVGQTSSIGSDERRAQVFAQFDFLRSELPEMFFRNDQTSDGATAAASYPLNFGAAPYPTNSSLVSSFALPLGNNTPGLYSTTATLGYPTPPLYSTPLPPTGMFGASFSAAAGIYKNLGYAKTGYDGIDNNGNGLIDDLAESGTTLAAVNLQLAKHTHNTARSEMLYAILVGGLGPLGSVFSADDFSTREVQDTDGDGLPEFVDAWGQPLQFYRLPIYYGATNSAGVTTGATDSQKGYSAYNGFTEAREQDPLDPNQLLVAPAWWSSTGTNISLTTPVQSTFAPPNGGTPTISPGAMAFMNYFHILVDPASSSTSGTSWDRGGGYARRAYFSRFLILSSGPDREPGVAQFNKDYSGLTSDGSGSSFAFPNSMFTMEKHAQWLTFIENQAAQADPSGRTGSFWEVPSNSMTTTYLQNEAGIDDISNHNLSSPSTGVR